MLVDFRKLETITFSGNLTCFAGREIELANSFDLLAAKLFFEIEGEFSDPAYRMKIGNIGANEFADLYQKLGGHTMFPTQDLLSRQLSLADGFPQQLGSRRVEELSGMLIRFWNEMIQLCFFNSLSTTSTSVGMAHFEFLTPTKVKP